MVQTDLVIKVLRTKTFALLWDEKTRVNLKVLPIPFDPLLQTLLRKQSVRLASQTRIFSTPMKSLLTLKSCL
jgi:hypothetical protein